MSTEQNNVPMQNPTLLPDGTPILSGPVPGGQIASNATQVASRSSVQEPLSFAGVPGGMFTIYGADFGPVGMVHVGTQQVTVTSWQHYRIKGLLPPGLSVKQDVTITDGLQNTRIVKYVAPVISAPVPVAK